MSARIAAPTSGWVRIIARSSAVSASGLRSNASGTATLPMSWRQAPNRMTLRIPSPMPEVPRDRVGHPDEPRRVLLGLVVLRLERVGEHHREPLEHRGEKPQAQRLVGKLAALERAVQHGEQVHRLERLGDERDRACLHRLHGEVEVTKRGDHDARDHRIDALRVGDEVDAVGVRHRVVGDHRIEAAWGVDALIASAPLEAWSPRGRRTRASPR